MTRKQWQLGTVGNHPSICLGTQGNQGKPETKRPVTDRPGTDVQPVFWHLTKKKKEVVRLHVDNNYIIQVRTTVWNENIANRHTFNIPCTLPTTTTIHCLHGHLQFSTTSQKVYGSMSFYPFHSQFYHFTSLPSISNLCHICPLLPQPTLRYAPPDHLTSLTDCH